MLTSVVVSTTMLPMNKSPLRQCREEMGLSVNRVARDLDIDAGNLSRMERGLMAVSPQLAEKLARHYGYRISEMQILYPERFVSAPA